MADDGTVLAVRVQLDTDEWHFVADDTDELEGRLDGQLDADQCGGCGSSEYTIVRDEAKRFYALCSGNEYADGSTHGCGARYRIEWHDDSDTIF